MLSVSQKNCLMPCVTWLTLNPARASEPWIYIQSNNNNYRWLSLSQLLISRYYCLSQSETEVPTFFSIHLLSFNCGYLKVWIIWNYGYLKVDFRPQSKIFICFNTAYLKVWFVKLKKHTFDTMMNTRTFCGRNLKLITMSQFNSLPSPIHTFYVLTKWFVIIAVDKCPNCCN